MKVFISWSGPQAEAVALALRSWLKLVIQSLEPWMSQADIRAGDRWSSDIGSELEAAHFGIICVTPSNQTSPWLNFEAGALSKNLAMGKVVPYLHGVSLNNLQPGPLKQFQAKESNKSGTWEMITTINGILNSPLEAELLRSSFELAWPRLEEQLGSIEISPEDSEKAKRSPEDKLDDVMNMIRNLQENYHEQSENMIREARSMMLALESTGAFFEPKDIINNLLLRSAIASRAFLKPAKAHVDNSGRYVYFDFSTKNEFHYKQALTKKEELQTALDGLTAGRYRIIIRLIQPTGHPIQHSQQVEEDNQSQG